MGVIKKVDPCSINIRSSISEETLYIPSSDDERGFSQVEDENINQTPRRVIRHNVPTIGTTLNLKVHSGKKKSRRYQNVSQLMTLAEEDELNEVTINDFVESTKSPFAVLLEDNKSYQKWDEFVSRPEEEQKKTVTESTSRKKRNQNSGKEFNYKINVVLKSLMRRKHLPVEMLEYLERELVSFFSAEPTNTYVSPALSSFERLLLHSVSDYHRLLSFSFDSEPDRVRLVRVRNPRKDFPSVPLLLVEYLESKYNLK